MVDRSYGFCAERQLSVNSFRFAPVPIIGYTIGVMLIRTDSTIHAIPRPQTLTLTLLGYLLIGLVVFWLRTDGLGGFLTVDEAEFWIARSGIFLDALRAGDFAATGISTHPGVTTMWLGAAGLLLREWLWDSGLVRDVSFQTGLALLRLPVALTHIFGLILGYALLRRMLAPAAAFLAALLWATDPFVLAFSRVLHVDGLLMTFATLSILAACIAWHRSPHPGWLVLSGVCAALAILSKSPGIILIPVVAALALLQQLRNPAPWQRAVGRVALWGAVCGITMVAFWPALWAGPVRAYELLRVGVEVEGASPHMLGNYFLGRPDDAPGPLFYPTAVALRTTPITLLGLLLLPFVWRRVPLPEQRDLAALALFAIAFTAAISIFPKKFNRYVVPVFPALDILAAIGVLAATALLLNLLHRRGVVQQLRTAIINGAVALVGALALLNALWWHPYGIAAFNQVLGGAQAGANTFLIGWGEGFEQVAAWLAQQPDITGVQVVARPAKVIQPFLPRKAQVVAPEAGQLPPDAGYLVVYTRQAQDGELPPPYDRFFAEKTPLHTVLIHGVPYAWIYQTPPRVAERRIAAFGSTLHLHGFDPSGIPQPGSTLRLRLVWEVDAPLPTDYTLFAHLIDPDGQRVWQADLPYPTASWQPGRFTPTELPITLPENLAPGVYRLMIGMYTATDNRRLPLTADQTADPALAGSDALQLTTITLP